MKFAGILGVAVLCCVAASSPALAQSNCEKLKDLKLENATVASAEIVAAGPFKLPPGLVPSVDVPAFCRVKAELKPSADSLIKMELWLPADVWNGKFEQVGVDLLPPAPTTDTPVWARTDLGRWAILKK
jgi:hypothetical protein